MSETRQQVVHQHWFVCACFSADHSARFMYWEDDQEMYVSISLCTFPFWKRVKAALAYVLGRHTPWGQFDEMLIAAEDYDRYIDLFQRAKQSQAAHKK